jgi:hypothetical protein
MVGSRWRSNRRRKGWCVAGKQLGDLLFKRALRRRVHAAACSFKAAIPGRERLAIFERLHQLRRVQLLKTRWLEPKGLRQEARTAPVT